MDETNSAIYEALENLVAAANELNQLFANDKQMFLKNDPKEIAASNNLKIDLLNQLNDYIQKIHLIINSSQKSDKIEIVDYIKKLDTDSKGKVSNTMNALYSSLSQGYKHLVISNHVVNDNLNIMNQLWDRLLLIAKQESGIYAKPEMK